ncbi:LuxR C-terminal-related transcriptional regulator [Klebsiella aerogenes]|uniref:LuxR C-terminal-related transcriptional regulator n=1 Tax=Klebsiella aerogenes TaxID=548 RepID=UPI0034D1A7E0
MLHTEVREWNPNIIVLSDDLSPELTALAAGTHTRITVFPERIPVATLYRRLRQFQSSSGFITHPSLTPCENRVLTQLRTGKSLSQIATDTCQNIKTLSSHKNRLMLKMGVADNLTLLSLLNDPGFDVLLRRQNGSLRRPVSTQPAGNSAFSK